MCKQRAHQNRSVSTWIAPLCKQEEPWDPKAKLLVDLKKLEKKNKQEQIWKYVKCEIMLIIWKKQHEKTKSRAQAGREDSTHAEPQINGRPTL